MGEAESTGTVREWTDEGWGIIVSPELGEVCTHFSSFDFMSDDYAQPQAGDAVEFAYIDMSPGTQDGYRYRTESARRV